MSKEEVGKIVIQLSKLTVDLSDKINFELRAGRAFRKRNHFVEGAVPKFVGLNVEFLQYMKTYETASSSKTWAWLHTELTDLHRRMENLYLEIKRNS